jgi:hypothetical protein
VPSNDSPDPCWDSSRLVSCHRARRHRTHAHDSKIPYELDGGHHDYYPDFRAERNRGLMPLIIEVKEDKEPKLTSSAAGPGDPMDLCQSRVPVCGGHQINALSRLTPCEHQAALWLRDSSCRRTTGEGMSCVSTTREQCLDRQVFCLS